MTSTEYAAAPTVAAVAAEFLARHAPTAVTPAAAAVAAVVDAAFWASLRHEEGRAPRISLALVPPGADESALRFARPISLAASSLARLAPAVERPGIHLAVWEGDDGALHVWGATRWLPPLCLVLEVVEPGLLVLKYRRGAAFTKFGNLAVLHGRQLQVVDESRARADDDVPRVGALEERDGAPLWTDAAHPLVQLAVSMRGHGLGGSLLVVPHASDAWCASIVQPILYAISPPFAQLARHERAVPDDAAGRGEWEERRRRLVDGVAGLTAVDGATVMTDRFEILAFGAKIGRREGSAPVERVRLTAPVVGDEARIVSPGQLGGTRHLSAAQFAHDQRDALALVASRDGHFTQFAWSPAHAMVHAHRLEVLLL